MKLIIGGSFLLISWPAYASGRPALLIAFLGVLLFLQVFEVILDFLLTGKHFTDTAILTFLSILGWIGLLTSPSDVITHIQKYIGLSDSASLFLFCVVLLYILPLIGKKVFKAIRIRVAKTDPSHDE